jgi:hypothetical protein
MRIIGILGVLCLAAAPTLGANVVYTFNTTAGNVMLNVGGQGSTSSALTGTFSIYLMNSGDFLLDAGGLTNTSTMKLGLAGLVTATVNTGSAKFLDFNQPIVGHYPGGIVNTDVYVEATVFVTGMLDTLLATKVWAGSLLPFNVSMLFVPDMLESSTLFGGLSGTFGYAIGVTDISLTLTLDLVVNVEGTAHVVPDPALGGLTALGLGGAGAWLRRRRS